LNALGYAKVRHYVGGKKDWIRAGLLGSNPRWKSEEKISNTRSAA